LIDKKEEEEKVRRKKTNVYVNYMRKRTI